MKSLLTEVRYCLKTPRSLFDKKERKDISKKIPVVFHNLRGYDSHFIMQQVGKFVKKNRYYKNGNWHQMDINVIPNNMEKYMTFTVRNHLKFIDSFQFMSSSLDALVKNLPEDAFNIHLKCFGVNSLI